MSVVSRYAHVGISATMLFPESFENDLMHYAAVKSCAALTQYDALDMFFPDDPVIRAQEIKMIKGAGKTVNYNSPMAFQQESDTISAVGDTPELRAAAVELAKRHFSYAAEADAKLFVLAASPDKGPETREERKKRYFEFFVKACEIAKQYDITVVLEPIERHRFKKLLMGPTPECAEFIKNVQRAGCPNGRLMLDTHHVPLMEEDMETAVKLSVEAGLSHVHIGDAVVDSRSVFYGHTHPPFGVPYGMFDVPELTEHLCLLMKYGYLPTVPTENKPTISWEIRPYVGVSEAVTAQANYEKLETAFISALARMAK